MSSSIGYIGSKISLISRSDIRYVGILHSINQADSTVALEQVRSYGTEGRRGNPPEEIPPSDNVFEYIVFRGSDVKDLHVCEAPTQQQSIPQVPNDPAILGTTAPRQPNFQGFAPPPPLGVQPPPNFPGTPLNPFYLQQINSISENANKEAEQPKIQQQKGHTITEKSEDHKTDRQTSMLKQFSKTSTSSRSSSSTTPSTTSNHRNESSTTPSANPSHVSTTHSINTTNTTTKETPSTAALEILAKKVIFNNNRSTSSNNKLPGMGGHLVQQNRRSRGSRRSYNQSYDRNRIPVPQSDFDFESSNAKFNKEEIVKEKGWNNKDQMDAERRQKQSEERRLNLETFGQVSIDGGRYRGSYRGRGYRGGRGSNGNNISEEIALGLFQKCISGINTVVILAIKRHKAVVVVAALFFNDKQSSDLIICSEVTIELAILM
ncbi:6179_t:CDS:10 [Entrophospora sp. SA101]|nr:6179_t:CDS:10 [Entrophospora sp. SA101]